MAEFKVEAQRCRPSVDGDSVLVENGVATVEADTAEDARTMATGWLESRDVNGFAWREQGTGVKSGDGIAFVTSTSAVGPHAGLSIATRNMQEHNASRSKSPMARANPNADPRPVKMPAGAKPLPGPDDGEDDDADDVHTKPAPDEESKQDEFRSGGGGARDESDSMIAKPPGGLGTTAKTAKTA